MPEPIKPAEPVVTAPVTPPTPQDPVVKTADEVEAEAKVLEAELATLEGGQEPVTDPEAKKLADQTKRLEIAQAKIDAIKNPSNVPDEFSVQDQVALGLKGIALDSEKAKVLQSYIKAGKATDVASAMEHVGAKAEIAALDAAVDAKNVINENDTPENQLKTKDEAVAAYKASGEFPEDAGMQEAVTESNLKDMGLE